MYFNKTKRLEAIEFIDFYFKKDKRVKIEPEKQLRSLNQNSYQHGVIYSIFAIDKGWTLAEAKQYFKDKFLSYYKENIRFVKETSKLSTKETEEYLESCRFHALTEHHCRIPVPNEVTNEMLEEIAKYEKYIK